MNELNDKIEPVSDVWLGDCMEYMKQFPDGFFDWGIVDPPYGIGCETGSSDYTKKRFQHRKSDNWDKCVPDQNYFNELMRVTKFQIIWGGKLLPFGTIQKLGYLVQINCLSGMQFFRMRNGLDYAFFN
jgi:hypothetical protein